MGLLQQAVTTYDCNSKLAGIYLDGKEPLAPVGHALTSASIEITLNQDGVYQSSRKVDKTEPKILIPVTEESCGRTSAPVPHPLCDQLKYLSPDNPEAYGLYCRQLNDWCTSQYSHPFLLAVLAYIKQGTIIKDLSREETLQTDNQGEYNEKLLVRWKVDGFLDEQPECWKNFHLFKAFIRFYQSNQDNSQKFLCMITGDMTTKASQHPKGIIPINGNAKLISANDTSGFTYRGRFTLEEQAVSIGYEASQKAHNALRWLVADQGVRDFSGNRVFLCWNPQGQPLPKILRPMRISTNTPRRKPSDYQEDLKGSLFGFRSRLTGQEKAVVAAFDAATTGRLALTYYNELSVSCFLDRMESWDAHSCWNNGKYGIQAPGVLQIVDCAFGTLRGAFLETDYRIQRQHIQRLLNAKLSGGIIPLDIVKALTQRASFPQAYDEPVWRKIMWVACAALQKYRFDTHKGGEEMTWDLDRKERSFQFGRLLAVMERAEADYYYKSQETRQTNAIKFMSEYRQRPWAVFERINRQLHQAYLNRIDPRQAGRYERLKDEIVAILGIFPESELNKPLNDLYLMGYELQRNAFFEKKDASENGMEE